MSANLLSLKLSLSDCVEYEIGDLVYSPVNKDKCGQITGILFRHTHISYGVTWCDLTERWHGALELTRDKTL